MNAQLPQGRVIATLVWREFLEHRLLFVYLPLLCTVAGMIWFTSWLVRDGNLAMAAFATTLQDLPPAPRVVYSLQASVLNPRSWAFFVNSRYLAIEGLMNMVMWGSLAYYFLYTLYQQRKDRSILFWNSLPVSAAQTIFSKLLAGLIVCHALYLLCLVVLMLYMVAAVWLHAAISGVAYWDGYLADPGVPRLVGRMLVIMPLATLWGLPVFAWLLFASAWAKRAPFAWAAGPWLLLVLAELLYDEHSVWILSKTLAHLLPVYTSSFQAHELYFGGLLGALFIYAAIRFNRRDEV